MTLTTIRGATGDIRLLYMFSANVKASCNIAFYVAATHGGKDVALDILETEQEATYAMMVLVWADILVRVLGPTYKSYPDFKQIINPKNADSRAKALGNVKANYMANVKTLAGYTWLMPAFWDMYMFNLGSTSLLAEALTNMFPDELACKWEGEE